MGLAQVPEGLPNRTTRQISTQGEAAGKALKYLSAKTGTQLITGRKAISIAWFDCFDAASWFYSILKHERRLRSLYTICLF
jgi:hypothetical protein